MLTSVQMNLLQLAAENKLPYDIEEGSGVDLIAFEQLWRHGLVDAVDARADTGGGFLDPRITIAGQAYLVMR
jgi:hypothetical protein